ncbi:hypothetical protein GPECTOR_14g52 [Gonium pectorale]|uniref:Uncharacterized protein n=1 Tax=Gonium pectorale TaxID=33097 RepID=A0A150GMN1_GONPE|nr:hypothetical protein GPECTOR_14g52 [Gonium pectorale]|eukprot:KXZ51067.1 hypothetical protein GPECTOR_14g52 [Gonium pectorale]
MGEGDPPLLSGALFGAIKAEASTWYIDDGVLTAQLLKRSRRGHYSPSTTNADTWWRSLWAACPPDETIDRRFPPTRYYWSEYEESDLPPELPPLPLPPAAGRSQSRGSMRGVSSEELRPHARALPLAAI